MRSSHLGVKWVVLLVLGGAAVAAAADRNEKNVLVVSVPQKWALLIGVNGYAEIRPLQYCVPDIEALKEKLTAAGFREDHVFLLGDNAAELKYKPTKINIERQLEGLVQLTRPDDLLVVAFSGHGVHLNDTSYLCPADANLAKPHQTLVSLDKVYQTLNSCPARQKLLLVDACRNDPYLGGDKGPEELANSSEALAQSLLEPPKGILVLASCDKRQKSWEDDKLRHGVFMHFLLKGIEGAADREEGNRDGKVSLLELYRYAEDRTKTYVFRSRNATQTPALKGEITGDYEIAAVSQRAGSGPERPSPAVADKPAAAPAEKPIAVPQAVKPLPKPSIPGSSNSVAASLLRQGDSYYASGDFESAIHSYSNAINLEPNNASLYLKRGAAYQAKGDFKMGVADYQAAGRPLELTVTAAKATIQVGSEVKATVTQGQTLNVGKVKNLSGIDWLWVDAVNGNDAAQGWIAMDAVARKPAATSRSTSAAGDEPAGGVPNAGAGSYAPESGNYQGGNYGDRGSNSYADRSQQRTTTKRQELLDHAADRGGIYSRIRSTLEAPLRGRTSGRR